MVGEALQRLEIDGDEGNSWIASGSGRRRRSPGSTTLPSRRPKGAASSGLQSLSSWATGPAPEYTRWVSMNYVVVWTYFVSRLLLSSSATRSSPARTSPTTLQWTSPRSPSATSTGSTVTTLSRSI